MLYFPIENFRQRKFLHRKKWILKKFCVNVLVQRGLTLCEKIFHYTDVVTEGILSWEK
jgi:hypothetical protein